MSAPPAGDGPPVAARFRCSVCKRYHAISLPILVRLHPAVSAFYYDRGVPILYERPESDDFQPRHSEIDYVADFEEEIVREEPPRVRLRIRYEGDELQVTLDEDLTVVDVVGPVSPEDS